MAGCWINYLADTEECRKRGFGPPLIDEAESPLRAIGCPKTNLRIRTPNAEVVAFYPSLGLPWTTP